jgi:predicted nucleic acid-binding protein
MISNVLSFVIDADIARSSGTTEHPVSSGSRKLLESVSAGGHKVAMCPVLLKEWKVHRSYFATKWMASMVAKKKVLFIKPVQNIKLHIENEVPDSKEKEIALKDAHLLDAALSVDKIIASNDARARAAFCSIAHRKKEISTIAWFNAVADRDFFCEKILIGAFVPDRFYLTPEIEQ